MSHTLILDPKELATLLIDNQVAGTQPTNANLCLVDLRSAEAYAAGHLPGAVHGNAALLSHIEVPTGGLTPKAEQLNGFLSEIGANLGDHIVAYDGGRETAAARLLWVLDAYGYPMGSWLNGGYAAWQAESLPISHSPAKASPGDLRLTLVGDNVISAESLMAELENPAFVIVDARSAAEFAGTDVRSTFGGHVPSACHLEWTTLFDEQGRLLEDKKIRTLLESKGIMQDRTTIVYCQTHQRSAVTYIALKHLGYNDVRALDGAWSNWGNRTDTPKA